MLDYRNCELAAGDRALCEYAVKLTLSPHEMTQADIDKLKSFDFDDHQITIATQVIGYFNYINRVADGLNVDLEDWMTMDHSDWLSSKPNWRERT